METAQVERVEKQKLRSASLMQTVSKFGIIRRVCVFDKELKMDKNCYVEPGQPCELVLHQLSAAQAALYVLAGPD